MKSKFLKKSMGFLLSLLSGLCMLPAASQAAEITPTPFSLPAAPKITFASDEVDYGESLEVTVTFLDTMNRKVPFTIELTNGAEIAQNTDVNDVPFQTNHISGSMSSITVHKNLNGMDVLTGQCVKSKVSSFQFMVQAPVDAKEFQVILITDSSNDRFKTIPSDKIPVISGLTIEAPDVLNDADPFDVTGSATYKHQSVPEYTHMFLEIVNQDPDQPYFYEVQMVEPIVHDQYQFPSIQLPSDYEDGDYTIKVYLINNEEYQIIGYAEKDVKFVKKPDVLQVSVSSQQSGECYTLDEPEPGQGVTYPELYVNPERGWYVPNGYNIQSKVVLKPSEAKEAAKASFIVTTSFGDQAFPAAKSGTSFTANLDPLRTKQTVVIDGIEQKPFISFVYTRPDGTENKIFVGKLEPVTDPGGYLFDRDTYEAVSGAKVTLYQFDQSTNQWILWEDPSGKQANPQTTNEKGQFIWDVEDGQYEIRICHPDYHKTGEYYSTLLDPDYGNVPVKNTNIRILLPKLLP